MSLPLAESYRHCARVARRQARNFYYSFLCLPPAKRAAMCAIYAFMRFSDDLSDGDGPAESGQRVARMEAWRAALERALRGHYGGSRILPAFHDTVRRYGIPADYFHALIDGASMDLTPRCYETFADTYRYCYLVASVVGLVCIHVFGFRDERAKQYAEWNGVAFQLTNILRDLREDAQMGRIYLPREELRRFGYSAEELRAGVRNGAFRELMRFQVERARDYYTRAAPLLELIEADSRPCLMAMREIYGGILEAIAARDYDVFTRRVALPAWRKWWIAGRALWAARQPHRIGAPHGLGTEGGRSGG